MPNDTEPMDCITVYTQKACKIRGKKEKNMLRYAIGDIDKRVLFLKKRINPKNKLFLNRAFEVRTKR